MDITDDDDWMNGWCCRWMNRSCNCWMNERCCKMLKEWMDADSDSMDNTAADRWMGSDSDSMDDDGWIDA